LILDHLKAIVRAHLAQDFFKLSINKLTLKSFEFLLFISFEIDFSSLKSKISSISFFEILVSKFNSSIFFEVIFSGNNSFIGLLFKFIQSMFLLFFSQIIFKIAIVKVVFSSKEVLVLA